MADAGREIHGNNFWGRSGDRLVTIVTSRVLDRWKSSLERFRHTSLKVQGWSSEGCNDHRLRVGLAALSLSFGGSGL